MLACWEDNFHTRIVDHFDLIAGTSTGGLIALGLGMGLSASAMVDFYRQRGPSIFTKASNQWGKPKYDFRVLEQNLIEAFGQGRTLAQAHSRLLIPTYDAQHSKLVVFHTPHERRTPGHSIQDPVKIGLATAAAPTYFEPAHLSSFLAIDGGVWANSPTLPALAEAVGELEIDPARIRMLSLGTTSPPKENALPSPKSWAAILGMSQGQLDWAEPIVRLMFNAQGQCSQHVVAGLLGSERFHRIDDVTQEIELDDVSKIDELISWGQAKAIEQHERVRAHFLTSIVTRRWNS